MLTQRISSCVCNSANDSKISLIFWYIIRDIFWVGIKPVAEDSACVHRWWSLNHSLILLSLYVFLSVRQLHREFLRAGSNVLQTFTFYCSEDKLEMSDNVTDITVSTKSSPLENLMRPLHCLHCIMKIILVSVWYHLMCSHLIQGAQINEAACNLARQVANEGDALVAGGVSQTPCYAKSQSETGVKAIFKKQMDDFLMMDIDFFIAEVWQARITAQSLVMCLNTKSHYS